MDLFIRAVRALSVVAGVTAAAALAAAVVVVCQMVVLRYFLGQSTIWQTEFVTFAVVGATFVGSPYVLLTKGHVNVDLLPLYLGHAGRVALALVASVLSLAFCLVIGWFSALYLHEVWIEGWRTETIWALPLWIPILPLVVGMALLSLQYVADILCLITGRDLPFGLRPEDTV